jgi:RNA polymerase sigma-70 factor (ECF subfamily)
LFGVIRRTATERARRRWLHLGLLDKWRREEPEAPLPPDPESVLCDSEHNRKLRAALAKLPRRQQEVLHLVFYQDMTVEESAQMLSISVGSARTHFGRGKERLRELLKDEASP